MSSDMVDKIAQAVLYEGYLLYPYRQSSIKNQQRWNFGVLYPAAWAAAQTGSDRSFFQMECLVVSTTESPILDVSVRFLQLVARDMGDHLWQEAVEQRIAIESLSLTALTDRPHVQNFSFPGGEDVAGGVTRRKSPLAAVIELSASELTKDVFRLTLRVRNATECLARERNEALMHSLASAHAVLQIRSGDFVSLVDPPEDLRTAVAACQNVGVWPVLVGETGVRTTLLGSPIILYDYPQVAPESKGDLFDGTEIDEILILRILTLTDDEKEEVRRSDDRARRILERLESSPPEHLLELHGTMRPMQPPRLDAPGSLTPDAWSSWDTLEGTPVQSAAVSGVELTKGDRVRLCPKKRADIFDSLLAGKIATIEAVEQDFENNIHFAVVLEDDPGKDLGEMRQAGHRFFFALDEVEPVTPIHSMGPQL